MPSLKATKHLIRQVVLEWYGLLTMPMTILTREEEVEEFEKEHDYIPPELWRFVNHPARQMFRWLKDPCCFDLVIWNKPSQSFRMIQDVCFKDAYPTHEEWRDAILAMLKDPAVEVWVVLHDEDDHPSSPA